MDINLIYVNDRSILKYTFNLTATGTRLEITLALEYNFVLVCTS